MSWKPNARADKYNVYRAVINGDAEITYELIETIIPTYNGKNMEYIDDTRVVLHYDLPLNEIIYDFFDVLKSRTKGYASFDYYPLQASHISLHR